MTIHPWGRIFGSLAWIVFAAVLAGAQVQWPPVYESKNPPKPAGQGKSALPAGFRAVATPGLGGTAAVSEIPSAEPADRVAARVLAGSASCFDGRPAAVTGVASRDGAEAQVLFRAQQKGVPLAGVLWVIRRPAGAWAGLAWDRADRFGAGFPGYLQALAAASGAGPAGSPAAPAARPAPVLSWQNFPDGSGRIKLPPGWKLDSYKGWVIGNGPEGTINLGMSFPVGTDPGIKQFHPTALVAPYTDPVTAFVQVMPQVVAMMAAASGQPAASLGVIRVVESAPVESFAGSTAAMLHAEYRIAPPGEAPRDAADISLVIIAPTGAGQWMFYSSGVGCRRDEFARNLPILMEIWKSYQVAGWVSQERMAKAMQSLREANQILEDTMAERRRSQDRTFADWDEYIRGYRTVLDTVTGDRYDVDLGSSTEVVRRLNEAEGTDRYREIPLRDLNEGR
jgi:hypothetical protein